MGEELATWEMIVVGVLAVGLLFIAFPGLKRLNEEARKAEKDWPGFLLPIGAVVLLIIVLIMFVARSAFKVRLDFYTLRR